MKIIGFVVSLALFVGGFYLMGLAFTAIQLQTVWFLGGILCTTFGVFIPVHIIKRIDA